MWDETWDICMGSNACNSFRRPRSHTCLSTRASVSRVVTPLSPTPSRGHWRLREVQALPNLARTAMPIMSASGNTQIPARCYDRHKRVNGGLNAEIYVAGEVHA